MVLSSWPVHTLPEFTVFLNKKLMNVEQRPYKRLSTFGPSLTSRPVPWPIYRLLVSTPWSPVTL